MSPIDGAPAYYPTPSSPADDRTIDGRQLAQTNLAAVMSHEQITRDPHSTMTTTTTPTTSTSANGHAATQPAMTSHEPESIDHALSSHHDNMTAKHTSSSQHPHATNDTDKRADQPASPRAGPFHPRLSPLRSPTTTIQPLSRPISPFNNRTLTHLKREASVSTDASPQPFASTSGSRSPSQSPKPQLDDDDDIKRAVKDEQEDGNSKDNEASDMDMSDSTSVHTTTSPRKTSSGGGGAAADRLDMKATPSSSRRMTKKVKLPTPEPQLISELPVAEQEALATYTDISECTYASKALGDVAHFDIDSTRCDCTHWPGEPTPCGEDSNCVNRLMQIECQMGECRCAQRCNNQRFQRKQYAPIDIVKTKKKGFGVRAKQDMTTDTFIYEYVGEVIGPDAFARRMKQYAASGIRHFYFMALDRDIFIDATKKGGKGRFLNHSCNPNCVVAKWTIGKKMHMGIFAKRDIKQDEELTFNYNVDRYGHEAQECYCGEPNCVGYIGGKTQTDIGGMDDLYLDALGIAEEVEALNLRGTKKKKGKKLDEDFWPELKPIKIEEVPKVSAAVRQSIQTRRILQKLLSRIQMTRDSEVRKALLRLHGFNVMNHIFKEYPNDKEIIALDLEILSGWELQQRNKVESSGIEEPVKRCAAMSDDKISDMANKEAGEDADRKRSAEYNIDQIFKRARTVIEDERPDVDQTQSKDLVKPPNIIAPPTSTRSNGPTLPHGWRQHRNEQGKIYFENVLTREFQWVMPSQPAKISISSPVVTPLNKSTNQIQTVDVNDIIAKAQAEAAALERAKLEEEEKLQRQKQQEEDKKRRQRKKSSHNNGVGGSNLSGGGTTAKGGESLNPKDKKIMGLFSTVVVQVMSKYKQHFESDQFKKRAKEVTLLLIEKERKHPFYATDPYNALSAEKAAKVKSFTKEWTKKLIDRRRTTTNDASTSVSTSANTATGDVGTPRNDQHSGTATPSVVASPSPQTPSAITSSTSFQFGTYTSRPSSSSTQPRDYLSRREDGSNGRDERDRDYNHYSRPDYDRRDSIRSNPSSTSMVTPQTPLVAPRDVEPVSHVGQGLDPRDKALVRDLINGTPRDSHHASTPTYRRD
ncbi:histone methyltransferase set2 [Microbotryomycetes sp. JL221]|nr:histone methyltransferase set2 [Microbotryomycetes sp. JL221]